LNSREKSPEDKRTLPPVEIVNNKEREEEDFNDIHKNELSESSESYRPPTPGASLSEPEIVTEPKKSEKKRAEATEELTAMDALLALANKETPVLNGAMEKHVEEEESDDSTFPVSLDHCYSLPPMEERKRQEVFNHDHGYTLSPPAQKPLVQHQEKVFTVKSFNINPRFMCIFFSLVGKAKKSTKGNTTSCSISTTCDQAVQTQRSARGG
jgi:hypothetical protein